MQYMQAHPIDHKKYVVEEVVLKDNHEQAQVILRNLTRTDLKDFLTWATDPDVAKYMTWEPYTNEEDALYFLINVAETHPYFKANRLIAFSEEEGKKGQYQNLNSLNLSDLEKRIVWLKDLAFPVALITKIFKNEDGSTGILHLVTNDLDSDADRVYEVYQKRRRIEEYHKSIKQNTSLEKSPTKVPRSQRNHIFASIVSYCKLEFLRIRTSLNHFALKYKLILRANQAAFEELKILREKVAAA